MILFWLHELVKLCCDKNKEIIHRLDRYNAGPLHFLAFGSVRTLKTFKHELTEGKIPCYWEDNPYRGTAEDANYFHILVKILKKQWRYCWQQEQILILQLQPAIAPLHWCGISDNGVAVRCLLGDEKTVVDKEKQNIDGQTALLKAANCQSLEAFEELVKHESKLDVVDSDGDSIFTFIAGSLKIMKKLFKDDFLNNFLPNWKIEDEFFYQLNLRNKDLKTALDRAVDEIEHDVVVEIGNTYVAYLEKYVESDLTGPDGARDFIKNISPHKFRNFIRIVQAVLKVAREKAQRSLLIQEAKKKK
jgi:hypothetical protein